MEQKISNPQARVLLDPPPLVLDLDGTLIHTDTFHEMVLRLFYKKPLTLLCLPFWFLKGRAFAKARVAELTDLIPSHLPYNAALLSFAKEEAKTGRPLILATGTTQKTAQAIAHYLGIFQEVIGSDKQVNMTGPNKQKALLDHFGHQGFDYAGDSRLDTHIWKVSRKALVVQPKGGVLRHLKTVLDEIPITYFPRQTSRLWALLLALRPLFWMCSVGALSLSLGIALSSLASGLLISGDLLTLYKERASSSKKSIFAEGHLQLTTAFLLAPLLTLPPLIFFPVLSFYLPLFIGVDLMTRERPQFLRWTLLGLLQLLGSYFFLNHH